jgi:trimeric autotransporter adhesin
MIGRMWLPRIGVAIVLSSSAVFAQCIAGWSDAFAYPGVGGSPGYASDVGVFDPGTGPRLFVGGDFLDAGGLPGTATLAQWDGVAWSALPFMPGPNGNSANAFKVFDAGTGPALYVGFHSAVYLTNGMTLYGVGRWNGTAWSTLGSGLYGTVRALEVFDDGSGPALYAGGNFQIIGTPIYSRIAKWNGIIWSDVGGGVGGGNYPEIHALRTWTTAGGAGLYAAGEFATAGGVPASNIACWTGTVWTALGTGVPSLVLDAIVHDAGSGAALWVVGSGLSTRAWNGSAWSTGSGAPTGYGLATYDEGAGPALFVCGTNTLAGTERYSGGIWSGVPGGGTYGRAMTVYDDGAGPQLCLVGNLGWPLIVNVVRWNGATWSTLPGWGIHSIGLASSFASADPSAGLPMVVGGTYWMIGGVAALNVATFADGVWSPMGSGLGTSSSTIRALTRFDDGGGPVLYAGGRFAVPGSAPGGHIARWNGSTWTDVAGGVAAGASVTEVLAMTVFDDGAGPRLVVGGNFSMAGGIAAMNVASWDGQGWAPMPGIPGAVKALLVADLGAGPTLFAGGFWGGAGFVARRIPGGWQVLGQSTGPGTAGCNGLAVFDDGTGPALYAAGGFWTMNGQVASNVMRYSGGVWTQASPLIAASAAGVESLAVYDDGAGSALYAIGSPFLGAPSINLGRMSAPGVWSAVGGDVVPSGNGRSLAVIDDGNGPALFVGGIKSAAGVTSTGIGRWGPNRPRVSITQPGGAGGPIRVRNTWLRRSREYYNIFSDSLCGAVGTGPYLGLCAPDPSFLILQFNLPLGAVPIHFAAPVVTMTFGDYALPAGLWLDAVCFDYTGGVLGCASNVVRIGVQ